MLGGAPSRLLASSSRSVIASSSVRTPILPLRRHVGRQRAASRPSTSSSGFKALPSLDDIINGTIPDEAEEIVSPSSATSPSPKTPKDPYKSPASLRRDLARELHPPSSSSSSTVDYGIKPPPKIPVPRPPLALSDEALANRRAKLLANVESGRFSKTDSLPMDVWEAQLQAEEDLFVQEIRNAPDYEFEPGKGKSRAEQVKAVKQRIHRRRVQGVARRELMEEKKREEDGAHPGSP